MSTADSRKSAYCRWEAAVPSPSLPALTSS